MAQCRHARGTPSVFQVVLQRLIYLTEFYGGSLHSGALAPFAIRQNPGEHAHSTEH